MTEKISFVFDTNILLDFFVFKNPESLLFWDALKQGKIKAFHSDETLAELSDVLKRVKFKLTPDEVAQVLSHWAQLSQNSAIIRKADFLCRDPLDQKFLDLAVNVSPCVLVTKDKLVLKTRGRARKVQIEVLCPKDALKFIAPLSNSDLKE